MSGPRTNQSPSVSSSADCFTTLDWWTFQKWYPDLTDRVSSRDPPDLNIPHLSTVKEKNNSNDIEWSIATDNLLESIYFLYKSTLEQYRFLVLAQLGTRILLRHSCQTYSPRKYWISLIARELVSSVRHLNEFTYLYIFTT